MGTLYRAADNNLTCTADSAIVINNNLPTLDLVYLFQEHGMISLNISNKRMDQGWFMEAGLTLTWDGGRTGTSQTFCS